MKVKTIKRIVSTFLAASMLLAGSAFAAETEKVAEQTEKVVISLSEGREISLTFSLDEESFSRAEGQDVTWTLERTATYANPADGKFIPLHGESKMYPNEAGKIDLEDLQCATPRDTDNPFKVTSLETVFDSSEKSMTLSFSTQAITSRGNEGFRHPLRTSVSATARRRFRQM